MNRKRPNTSSRLPRSWLPVRTRLRSVALSALGNTYRFTGRFDRVSDTPRVQFLLTHTILEHQEPGFSDLLTHLSKVFQLISYSEAVHRVLTGDIDKAYLAISLDDGFKSCLRAARLMEAFGTTGCMFVCPPMIDGTMGVDSSRAQPAHFLTADYLTWDDIETLLDHGHEIGGHTMHHPVLSQCQSDRVHEEISQSYEALVHRLGQVQHFAWPYGRFFHFSQLAAQTVFDVGYHSCASGERGAHGACEPMVKKQLCIRRDEFIASAPWSHHLYFLTRSALTPMTCQGLWPSDWTMHEAPEP